MANQQLDLKKKVISSKYANSIYQTSFSNLAQTPEYIDNQLANEKVVLYYNELFYKIPKQGTKSHRQIVETEHLHLHVQENENLDNQIDQLLENQEELLNILNDLQNPIVDSHPLYENGSFITAGAQGTPFDFFENQSYLMQEGKKRKIDHTSFNGNLYKTIRKSLSLPIEEDSGFYFISLEELNAIPDGPDINNYLDLNLKGDQLNITDLEDLSLSIVDYYPYHEVTLYCYGTEQSDLTAAQIEAGGTDSFLTSSPCEITYLYNVLDFNDEPTLITETIPKGHFKKIQFIRKTSDSSMWPVNIDSLYELYGFDGIETADVGGGVYYNGNFLSNYVKKWGKDKKYAGVLNAVGRIKSKEHHPESTSTIELFNGLPNTWEVIEPLGDDWATTDAFLDDYGNPSGLTTITVYGTPKINAPGSGMWGGLNQSPILQALFNDTNFEYYKQSVSIAKEAGISFRPNDWALELNLIGGLNWEAFDAQGNFGGYRTSAFINYQNGNFKLYNEGKTFQIYGQPIYEFDNSYFVLCDVIDFRLTYGNVNQYFHPWEAYFVGSAAYNYMFGDLGWLIGHDTNHLNHPSSATVFTVDEFSIFNAMAEITDALEITNPAENITNQYSAFNGMIDHQALNALMVELFNLNNGQTPNYSDSNASNYGYTLTDNFFDAGSGQGNPIPPGFFQGLVEGTYDNYLSEALAPQTPFSQQFAQIGFGTKYENIGYPMSLFNLAGKNGSYMLFYDLKAKEFCLKTDLEMTSKLSNNNFDGGYHNVDQSIIGYKTLTADQTYANPDVTPYATPYRIKYSLFKSSAVAYVGLQGYGQACYTNSDNVEVGPYWTAYNGHALLENGGLNNFGDRLFLSKYNIYPYVSMFVNGYLKNAHNGYSHDNYFNPNTGGTNGTQLGGSNVLYNPQGGIVNQLGTNTSILQYGGGGASPGVENGVWVGYQYP